jgi:butyryl-CoA dehydrogenase
MKLELEAHQREFAEKVRAFADEVVAPQADEIDTSRTIPDELIQKLADEGYLGALIPKEYGGLELDGVSYTILIEEISRACAATGFTLAVHTTTATLPLLNYGTEEQKKKYLPELCKGLAAFSLTEPQAGSDPGSATTKAILEGSDWIIKGKKRFATNGGRANIIVLMAVTKDEAGKSGVSAFILDRDLEGLKTGNREQLMGIRGSEVMELILEGCKVPEANLLGELNGGMKIALNSLDYGRVGIAAQAVGIGQAALDQSVDYSKSRKQFGRCIGKFQAVQWLIADTKTEVEGARLLTRRAGALMDGEPQELSYGAAMAKLFASKTAKLATDRAVQIHGGGGYVKGNPVERLYRDAKITEIYEGTSEIMRMVLVRSLLK